MMHQKDGSEIDLATRPQNLITAWKEPKSLHYKLLGKSRIEEKQKKEKEEKEKKNSLILGIADLTSKNSARDFVQRANEKHKTKKNLSRALSHIAYNDDNLKEDYEENKDAFHKFFKDWNKKMRVYDDKKEEKFYEAYREKERADQMKSVERIGQDTMNVGDNSSKAAYSSVGGSRIGANLKRRRPTSMMEQETSNRPSAMGNKNFNPMAGRSSVQKNTGDGFINSKIDYYGRIDLVERA